MTDFSGQRVVILGLARQGTALARYLAGVGARVTVSDLRPPEQLAGALAALRDVGPVEYVLGGHPESLLRGADLLCLSGGVPADLPLALAARERGLPLSNDAQIFMQVCPARVVGITGSAGKTTTTTLVGRMLEAAPLPGRTWVGGNIGNPLIADVAEMRAEDRVVMELSSFQLELMTLSPQVGAILNLTPNHLDRHGTMQAYTAAKARLLDFQRPDDLALLGLDDPGAAGLRDRVRGRLWWFSAGAAEHAPREGAYLRAKRVLLREQGREVEVCATSEVALRGRHNLLNVLAASAIAAGAGAPPDAVRAGILGFGGVEHRLEFVRQVNGARWYNDSIATAPERAIAAIRAFDEPLVLLAGGRDKKLPWEEFAAVAQERVAHIVLFGEAQALIARAIGSPGGTGALRSVTCAATLSEAVTAAASLARPGDVVLLAPGGASFDEFKDFAERGERFRQLVHALP